MALYNRSYYTRIALIASEVILISLLSFAVEHYHPIEIARYISLDALYCLPIIQTAHLTALHSTRRFDNQTSNIVGFVVALVWSATEVAITWPHFPLAAFVFNTFTRSVAFSVIGRVVIKLWREREYANKDMLTGLANRVELMERLESEQKRSERNGSHYSLLYITLDEFKSLGEVWGSQVGEEALRTMADVLKECIRKVDIAVRLDGEEFALLMPDTDQRSCYILSKRIEASSRRAFNARGWPISVSIGKTTQVGKSQNAHRVIQIAHEDMHEARNAKQQMAHATGNTPTA